jgi:hypothetical protein
LSFRGEAEKSFLRMLKMQDLSLTARDDNMDQSFIAKQSLALT